MTELERIAELFSSRQERRLDDALAALDPRAALEALQAEAPSFGAWLVLARRGGCWAWEAASEAAEATPLPWLALIRDAAACCVTVERTPALRRRVAGWQRPSAQEVAWTLGALSLDGRDLLREITLDPQRDPFERVNAVQALRYHQPTSRAVDVVRVILREPDAGAAHVMRREAALTAGHLRFATIGADLLVSATDGDRAAARTARWALERAAPEVHRRLAFVTRPADDLASLLPSRILQVLKDAESEECRAWVSVAGRTGAASLVPALQRLRAERDDVALAAAAALLRITGNPDLLPDALRAWAADDVSALPALEAIAEAAAFPEVLPALERALVEVGTTETSASAQARLLEVAAWLKPDAARGQALAALADAQPDVARDLNRLLVRLRIPA